jgi:hypothetical protein
LLLDDPLGESRGGHRQRRVLEGAGVSGPGAGAYEDQAPTLSEEAQWLVLEAGRDAADAQWRAGREMLEQLEHAHRVQAKIEAKMGVERRVAEQQRAYGEARDRHEVREQLCRDFQEAQHYLRRSTMSAESKSRAINAFGVENYFRLRW